jgi:hypothetical protein
MTYHSSIRADDPSSELPFEVFGFLLRESFKTSMIERRLD